MHSYPNSILVLARTDRLNDSITSTDFRENMAVQDQQMVAHLLADAEGGLERLKVLLLLVCYTLCALLYVIYHMCVISAIGVLWRHGSRYCEPGVSRDGTKA